MKKRTKTYCTVHQNQKNCEWFIKNNQACENCAYKIKVK